ncbi:MAG: cupin domain-containing protein [Thermoplasmata archaeon]
MKEAGTVKDSEKVVKESVPNAEGIEIQWLISQEEGSDRIYMRKFTLAPGADMKLHSHPHTEHIQYYLKGEVKLIMGSNEYDVSAGDSIYIPPGVKHKYMNKGTADAEFLCMISGGEIETKIE